MTDPSSPGLMQAGSAPPPQAAWTTRECALLALLLLVHVVLAWHIREPGITYRNDDALYLLLSRALASFKYANLHLVEPSPHTQYPPGYPLFLFLISRLAGERLDVFLAAGMLCSAGAVGLFFALVRRRAGPLLAFAVTLPVATNVLVLQMAGSLLAEPLFLFFTMLALWSADRADGRSGRVLFSVGAGVAGALTRSIGTPLLAALVLYFLLRRDFRQAVIAAAVSAATVGVWLAYTFFLPLTTHVPGRSYAYALQSIPEGEERHLLLQWKVVAYRYRIRDFPDLFGLPGVTTVEARALWGSILGAVLLLGIVLLWRRLKPAAIYLVLGMILLLSWPVRSSRFLYGLVPLILLCTFLPVDLVARRSRWLHVGLLGLLSVALTAGGLAAWRRDWDHLGGCNRAHAVDQPGCFVEDGRTLYLAARMLGSPELPAGGVLTIHEPMVAYYSGRPTANLFTALRGDSTAFLENLRARGIRYLILGRTQGAERRVFAPIIAQWCRRLELVVRVPPRALGYRIREPSEPDDSGLACGSITTYLNDSTPVPVQRK